MVAALIRISIRIASNSVSANASSANTMITTRVICERSA